MLNSNIKAGKILLILLVVVFYSCKKGRTCVCHNTHADLREIPEKTFWGNKAHARVECDKMDEEWKQKDPNYFCYIED